MLKITMIATALLSAAVAAPAMAQDADALSGLYAGAEVGYAKPKTKLDFTPKTGAAAAGSANKTGFDYSGFVGYGAVVGESLYLGGEASLGAGGGKVSRSLAGQRVTVDPGLRYGAAARAGFVVTEGGLLYGKVGLERRKVEASIIGSKKKVTEKGLVYGVGYEQQLSGNLSLRGEVLRVKYDDKSATFAGGEKLNLDGKETRVNLGAVIRF
ncbi:outer membrane beta-barrel protein [Caulobacter sp. 1776]|uniref:outer membrane protein n=1 Tax=Caulobacter sp. 1776 TaxID=3156420 RepID=UPI003399A18D